MESSDGDKGVMSTQGVPLPADLTEVFIPGGLIADDNEFGTLISASVTEEFIPRIGAAIVAIRILPVTEDSTRSLQRVVKAISENVRTPRVFNYIGLWNVEPSEMWLVSELKKSVSLHNLFSASRGCDIESMVAYIAKECLLSLQVLHMEHKQPHTYLRPESIHLLQNGSICFSDVGMYHVLFELLPSGRSVPGIKLWPFPNDTLKFPFEADIWDLGVTLVQLIEGGAVLARSMRSGTGPPRLSDPARWSPELNSFISMLFSPQGEYENHLEELMNNPLITETSPTACESAMETYFERRDEHIQGQFMNDTISTLFRQNSAVVRAPLINIDDISTDQFTYDHWQGSDPSRPTAELSILRMVQTSEERSLPNDAEESKVLINTTHTLQAFLDTADMI